MAQGGGEREKGVPPLWFMGLGGVTDSGRGPTPTVRGGKQKFAAVANKIPYQGDFGLSRRVDPTVAFEITSASTDKVIQLDSFVI